MVTAASGQWECPCRSHGQGSWPPSSHRAGAGLGPGHSLCPNALSLFPHPSVRTAPWSPVLSALPVQLHCTLSGVCVQDLHMCPPQGWEPPGSLPLPGSSAVSLCAGRVVGTSEVFQTGEGGLLENVVLTAKCLEGQVGRTASSGLDMSHHPGS